MRDRSSISLAVGRSCFVKCAGCYNHFSKVEELIDNASILAFLSVARNRGLESVTYCGGDPLSRPGIVELLHATKRIGLTVKLDTVGTPLLGPTSTIFFGRHPVDGINIEDISGAVDHFGIPIDGSDDDIMGQFRQGRGNFLAEQKAVLALLLAQRAHVSVNTVVTSKNLGDIEAMAGVISSISRNLNWELFQYSPSGPISYRRRADFEVSDEAFEDAVSRASAALNALGHSGVPRGLSNRSRKQRYVLIDSNGEAWMPISELILEGEEVIELPKRLVLGNIRDPNDYQKILSPVLTFAARGDFRDDLFATRGIRSWH